MFTIDEKTGLVLEGGGMRGVFTCGVLDCLIEVGRIERDTRKLTALYDEGYSLAKALQITNIQTEKMK
mgnify:CR=1 FL=1